MLKNLYYTNLDNYKGHFMKIELIKGLYPVKVGELSCILSEKPNIRNRTIQTNLYNFFIRESKLSTPPVEEDYIIISQFSAEKSNMGKLEDGDIKIPAKYVRGLELII